MKAKHNSGQKIICLNRKASFNYFFYELIEAGIVLKGSEVKSLRDGKGSIADSFSLILIYLYTDNLVIIIMIQKTIENFC